MVSEEGNKLLKFSIHNDTGNIFFDNVNRRDSISYFIAAQEVYDTKLLQISFSYSKCYDNYVSEYLTALKRVNDDKYDTLTTIISKSLFYNFNDYLNSLPMHMSGTLLYLRVYTVCLSCQKKTDYIS